MLELMQILDFVHCLQIIWIDESVLVLVAKKARKYLPSAELVSEFWDQAMQLIIH